MSFEEKLVELHVALKWCCCHNNTTLPPTSYLSIGIRSCCFNVQLHNLISNTRIFSQCGAK
jgi:hypothetical protein